MTTILMITITFIKESFAINYVNVYNNNNKDDI